MPALNTTTRRSVAKLVLKLAGTAAVSALSIAVLVRPTEDAVANGETRSLSLQHMHTGESIDITFKRNGQYDQAALEKLNWFLRDWRRKEPTRMDPRLFDTVWLAYKETRANQPIHVLCGYRAPETNEMLRHRSRVTGVAKFSQHTLGKAMDFYIPGVSLTTLRVAGLHLQRGGVGFYPTSGSPFVHMDAGSVRMWPRMSRSQLASVFPDGKTVYLPAEGGKMPRYQEAFAEVMRQGGSVGGFQGSGGEDDGGGGDAAPASSPVSLIASLFGGGRNQAVDTARVETRQPAKAAPVAVAQADIRSADVRSADVRPEAKSVDPRLMNQALAALSGAADASAPAARSVVAMNDAVDAMPAAEAPVETASVPMPVPAPARLSAPQPAGPQLAWNTGAQPVAQAVPLPPEPALRPAVPASAAPALAVVPPMPPSRPQAVQLALADIDADAAPATQAAAIPAASVPQPPSRPVLQPGHPVTAAVASLDQPLVDMPRQFLNGQDGSFGQKLGRALGYAAADPMASAPAVTAPRVEFVAARFDQIDFGSLASPAAAARDAAQTGLYAPDLSAAPGLITVAVRMGPERVAMRPLHTAGFAGAQTVSFN